MNELHLFAGAGGGILGGILCGHTCVCAVEIEPYARKVLLQRQRDGILPRFPIWDDVTTFSGAEWRGRVDVVCGGFPCQDISAAGNGAGLDGERSGLWAEMARIVGEVQPTYVWVENSPMLLVRGIDRVLWDLAALGYDARWGVVSAADAGAPHVRERCWILAHAMQARSQERMEYEGADSLTGCSLQQGSKWQEADSDVLRVADGVANRVDRISAIGNGQVPAVVRLAWETLMGQSMHNGDREIK